MSQLASMAAMSSYRELPPNQNPHFLSPLRRVFLHVPWECQTPSAQNQTQATTKDSAASSLSPLASQCSVPTTHLPLALSTKEEEYGIL